MRALLTVVVVGGALAVCQAQSLPKITESAAKAPSGGVISERSDAAAMSRVADHAEVSGAVKAASREAVPTESTEASSPATWNPFAAPWTVSSRTAVGQGVPATAAQNKSVMLTVPPQVWQWTMVEPKAPGETDAGSGRLATVKRLVAAKYDVTHIGERGIGKGLNFYSIDKEIMLGREISDEVEKKARLLNDPLVNEYVNRLAQNLVRNSDARVPFTVKIIDSDEINAFALPGGFFYINTGLLRAVDNEAELAGVMAHEIGHVAARHATKMATKKEIWDLASLPLIFVGGPAGMAVRNFMGLAVPMSFLKFSRNDESEADLLGMEYQYAAGYDPSAFVEFFEKLSSQEKHKANLIAKAFATHPMTDDRIKRSQKVMETMLPGSEEYLVTTSEFEDMKARLQQIEGGRRTQDLTPNKPTLRRASAAEKAQGGMGDGPVVR